MQVGERDGHGRYGVLDDGPEGLLCHECGKRFKHLGLHAFKGHGKSAAAYRQAHGLRSRGLVTAATREVIAMNARARIEVTPTFAAARDPARATAARLGRSTLSPAGLESIRVANRSRRGTRRLGTVVVCLRCGAEFCPLEGAKRRRFCSRSCASRYNRARRSSDRAGG